MLLARVGGGRCAGIVKGFFDALGHPCGRAEDQPAGHLATGSEWKHGVIVRGMGGLVVRYFELGVAMWEVAIALSR